MNKRGAFILFEQPLQNGEKQLIDLVNNGDYSWHIDQDEIYKKKDLLEIRGWHSAEKLKELNGKSDIGIIFMRLERWPRDNFQYKNFEKYEDYVNSECSLVLLCVDVAYYEIYCKDGAESKMIYDTFVFHPAVERIEYITDENDGRTGFDIGR